MKQNNKRKIKESSLARDWFRIGENDLGFVKSGFKDLNAFFPQICFLCQQSAEKYLKGFLVFYKKGFPKIHDLTELVKLCSKIDKNFSKILKDADILSQYYLVVRYPTEYKEAGKLEAREAIETAKRIADFVKDIIKAQL
ncbi:MAG: hypothetical protein A2909_02805 [Candidatus Tagabacteria bacterium RIFCSPLOWO2_01_FULL_39_11]|uniref:HEPN domain-containing protein n=1 Tax=Candidatus Tagabacteria bacterium RIFCSPLOWO2_01_FULL_39_11 TaxID=1802295 RepID=A0A1G2LTC3_9BACT|nr:MAG: hypothetical protein A2909_02805 [Candidatus Tagabacteria bacterium RIFCSPLOWO2_01_FULL_39_11]